MAKKLARSGFAMFMIGIGIFLLPSISFLHFLVPLLTIGGLCMMTIATFLSIKKSR